jgi:hypothetical protein
MPRLQRQDYLVESFTNLTSCIKDEQYSKKRNQPAADFNERGRRLANR